MNNTSKAATAGVFESSMSKAPLSWFLITGPVQQRPYLTAGICLALLKYVVEFALSTRIRANCSHVEPIRVWAPPRHLAFDVESQPHPMREWTPIPYVHPPHLDDGIRSLRGEFLLEPTRDGGTRLTGTTWYQLNVRPRLYWKCWADPVFTLDTSACIATHWRSGDDQAVALVGSDFRDSKNVVCQIDTNGGTTCYFTWHPKR